MDASPKARIAVAGHHPVFPEKGQRFRSCPPLGGDGQHLEVRLAKDSVKGLKGDVAIRLVQHGGAGPGRHITGSFALPSSGSGGGLSSALKKLSWGYTSDGRFVVGVVKGPLGRAGTLVCPLVDAYVAQFNAQAAKSLEVLAAFETLKAPPSALRDPVPLLETIQQTDLRGGKLGPLTLLRVPGRVRLALGKKAGRKDWLERAVDQVYKLKVEQLSPYGSGGELAEQSTADDWTSSRVTFRSERLRGARGLTFELVQSYEDFKTKLDGKHPLKQATRRVRAMMDADQRIVLEAGPATWLGKTDKSVELEAGHVLFGLGRLLGIKLGLGMDGMDKISYRTGLFSGEVPVGGPWPSDDLPMRDLLKQ